MSKSDDLAFIKMHFTSFGEDLLSEFKKQYDKKGLSFVGVSKERMCVKVTEEVGEVAACIFKNKDNEDTLNEIIDAANVLFMLYIKFKEER